MEKELICICCPMGCHLKVDLENKKVMGNGCKRGEVYGIDELTNPVRVITSTVKIENGTLPVISVKTNKAIPKNMNMKCMEELKNVVMKAPVKVGDIVVKNILGLDVDIIATRSIDEVK